MKQRESDLYIMVYTRTPVSGEYPAGLARSIHLAYSENGMDFRPLNNNYGVLFAKASISKENTIRPKGVKNPWVFSIEKGKYWIVAISVNEDGSLDEEMTGKALVWSTSDFITFHEELPLDIEQVVEEEKNCSSRLESGETVTGSTAVIDKQLCQRVKRYWSKVYNCDVSVPEAVEAASPAALENIKATLTYSDGSQVFKRVLWDASSANFGQKGSYDITGIVQSSHYPFPLAKGYGDPVILFWEGKKYYIATNDNKNDIGLYVREASTVEGLFAKGATEHLILGENEERDYRMAFWAPEFHVIGEDLYILFAVSGKAWSPQCHMMRLKKGQSITSPDSWTEPVRVQRKDGSWLAEDGITLDMTYIKAGVRSYVIWSYRRYIGTPLDTGSMLYIAEVEEKTPWKLISEPVLLSRPLFGWENVEGTINNEGPHAFQANGRVYLTYSGGSANGYTYVLGLLTAKVQDDLLNIANWEKSGQPVLSYYSVEGEYGPGHNSFFTDEDGNLMIAYHGETSMESHLRCVGIRRVHFGARGRPIFDMSADRDLNPALKQVSMKIVVG